MRIRNLIRKVLTCAVFVSEYVEKIVENNFQNMGSVKVVLSSSDYLCLVCIPGYLSNKRLGLILETIYNLYV